MKKEAVILTRSSKIGGYCVAGIDIHTGEWVRFVSDDAKTHGALSRNDIRYRDGRLCKPLDVVAVDIIDSAPLDHQPENFLIDANRYWVKQDEWTISDVNEIHPSEIRPYLYGNVDPYIDNQEINSIGYSLTLIRVSSLIINQVTNIYGKPKTKARFFYNGHWYYNMSVTDPEYYSAPDGTQFDQAYLVVSLPDTPFPENCYYKFIAQIYPL